MEDNVNNTNEPQHDAKLPVSGSLPFTEEELKQYIDGTYSWVNEHPKILMHIVAKWVTEKFVSSRLSNDR
jgi:hypothetical protein